LLGDDRLLRELMIQSSQGVDVDPVTVKQELDTGRYESAMTYGRSKTIDVLTAGVESLRQEDDIDRGRLEDLRRDALVGWEAIQRGEVVDGATAMAEVSAYVQAK
jgi:antitoxin ParD1/3/4